MIELRPKQHFQQHDEIKRELAKVVTSDNFQFALAFALSEYVTRSRPSAEQLSAVHSFVLTLLNLPVKDEPPLHFPSKTLDQSVYNPVRPETPVKY